MDKLLCLVIAIGVLIAADRAQADYSTVSRANCQFERKGGTRATPYNDCVANGNDPQLCQAIVNLVA